MLDLDGAVAASRRTAHEYVRDSLRQAILRGSVAGGQRLVQADLARELGVSTTPVREALRDLATEGLITLDAHRGAIVKQLSYAELLEIHELTKLLEPEAVRLAADSGDMACLDRADQLAAAMEQEADIGAWVDLNRQFHSALVECVKRRRLLGILQGLRDTAAPYIGLALQQRGYPHNLANEHHRELVAALRAGDADRAADIAAAHVDLTAQALEEARHLFDASGALEKRA